MVSQEMLAGILILVLAPTVAASTLRSRKIEPQPKSGDLVHQVKDALATDHRTLGKVSAALMSVQSEVDKTEENMLGKVLDLQTARSFFTRHEEIDTANDKLNSDISNLNTQVDGLSSTLSKTQKAFLSNSMLFRDSEGKLHTQLVENGALIGNMNSELAKEDDVQKELKRLTQIHKDLMAEGVNASEVGRQAVAMLDGERGKARSEVGRHKSLRMQLVKMNNYSIACHASVVKTSKKLGMFMVSASKDNQAAQLTMAQKKKATEATEQRLLAERALLVTEVKKLENEDLQAVQKVADLRSDLQIIQNNIVKEVRELQLKMEAQKERVKSLSVDLMENEQAEMDHNAKKEAMEAHLAELVKEVHESQNPITIATTEAQNDALQAELNEAYVLWKSSKTSETAAILNVDQAAASAEAAKAGVKTVDEMLVAARKEGRKKVREAVKEAMINKAKSQVLLEKAQTALAGRCKPDWDEIWKKKRAGLVKCKQWKEELSMEKAKKDTLMTTLKAQAEVQA